MSDEEGLGAYREAEERSSPAWLFDPAPIEPAGSLSARAPAADARASLIRDMSAGRVEALGQLHSSSETAVKKLALRITRDPALADEVTAATFLQAWIQAKRFNPARGSGMNWLLCIARSRSIDAIRAVDAAMLHPEPLSLLQQQQAELWSDPQYLVLEAERTLHLHRALDELVPLHRQLLALAYFKGSTHEEIAHQLALPLGTVKSHIKRALATLRRALSPYWGTRAPRTCLVSRRCFSGEESRESRAPGGPPE